LKLLKLRNQKKNKPILKEEDEYTIQNKEDLIRFLEKLGSFDSSFNNSSDEYDFIYFGDSLRNGIFDGRLPNGERFKGTIEELFSNKELFEKYDYIEIFSYDSFDENTGTPNWNKKYKITYDSDGTKDNSFSDFISFNDDLTLEYNEDLYLFLK